MKTRPKKMNMSIISGGQTGVDQAALDAALKLKIPCGGWCPKGRKAEDGRIDARYPLQESSSADYSVRTLKNVKESDGTLLLGWGSLTGGSAYTLDCAQKLDKPVLVLNLKKRITSQSILKWIQENKIKVLNVAGPRESHAPGRIYKRAYLVLKRIFRYP